MDQNHGYYALTGEPWDARLEMARRREEAAKRWLMSDRRDINAKNAYLIAKLECIELRQKADWELKEAKEVHELKSLRYHKHRKELTLKYLIAPYVIIFITTFAIGPAAAMFWSDTYRQFAGMAHKNEIVYLSAICMEAGYSILMIKLLNWMIEDRLADWLTAAKRQ